MAKLAIWMGLGLLAAAACGAEVPAELPGPAAGEERGPCYGNATCNAGLVCLSALCVRPEVDGGLTPDSGERPDLGALDGGAGLDAAPGDLGPDGGADLGPSDGPAPDGSPDGSAPDAEFPDLGPLDAEFPDLGPLDAEFPDLGPLDAGAFDTGPLDGGGPDGGGPCDPVTGVACSLSDRCHWVLPPVDNGRCGPVPAALPFEAACDPSMDLCDTGLSCLFLVGESAPSCHRICPLNGASVCSNLVGSAPSYVCGSVGGSQNFGACLGAGTLCDPLAPICPVSQTCTFVSGQTSCELAGTAQLNQACSLAQNCGLGQGMCFDLGGGGYCREVCDPAQPSCGAGANCVQLLGESYGACLPQSCSPLSNPCPVGICSAAAGALECRSVGTAPVGGACSPQADCAPGGFCVSLTAGMGQCYRPCDPSNPCPTGQCLTLTGLGFGICF